jgi:hypothetical protein
MNHKIFCASYWLIFKGFSVFFFGLIFVFYSQKIAAALPNEADFGMNSLDVGLIVPLLYHCSGS